MRKTHRFRTASSHGLLALLPLLTSSLGAGALGACGLNLDYLSAGGPLDAGDGNSSSGDDVASAAEAIDSADPVDASADAPACVAACPACAAPQVCCAQRCPTGVGNVTASCGDLATCTGPIACWGPQDCPSGQICCGSGANGAPLDTMCMIGPMCPSSRQLIVCRTLSDCPPPVNVRCAMGTSTAYLYSTCRGPTPDSGAD
jgi:hypothetical protein